MTSSACKAEHFIHRTQRIFRRSSKLDACGYVEFLDGLGMGSADSVQKWLQAGKVLRVPICRKMLHHSNTLDALESQ